MIENFARLQSLWIVFKLKPRSFHLESLMKFILPMHLLETLFFVVVKELPKIFEFELSFSLRGKDGPN